MLYQNTRTQSPNTNAMAQESSEASVSAVFSRMTRALIGGAFCSACWSAFNIFLLGFAAVHLKVQPTPMNILTKVYTRSAKKSFGFPTLKIVLIYF